MAGPGFSPDGTRLAFMQPAVIDTGAGGVPLDFYVMHDDGSNVLKITSAPIEKVVWASWTPDGRHLAVIEPSDGTNVLEVFDTEKQVPPVRLETPAIPDQIVFRPPLGNEILFRGLQDGRYGLFVMNADGSNVQTLIPPVETEDLDQDLNNATYSADGKRIFYQRWTPQSIQLWVMNADGTDPHEFKPETGQGWDGFPSPSPDGRWVAYWHVIEDGRTIQHVSVVRADGTGPIVATGPDLTGNAHWVWSPDSTKLLMYSEDSGNKSAYLLDPGGGNFTTVPWQSDSDLDWQRLGQ